VLLLQTGQFGKRRTIYCDIWPDTVSLV